MKNKYIYRLHINERKTRQIIKCLALDLTATQTAEMISVNIKTIDNIFLKIRLRVLENSENEFPIIGEFESDESYFGARRVKGKRGRGAGSKTIVFGLFKCNGKVYIEIVPNVKATTLSAIIRGKSDISSVIHTGGWRAYDGLVDPGYEKHYRVNHSENEFSKGNDSHINGVESFWGYVKHRLSKFKGIANDKFMLYY